jgi:hypothetical protein
MAVCPTCIVICTKFVILYESIISYYLATKRDFQVLSRAVSIPVSP